MSGEAYAKAEQFLNYTTQELFWSLVRFAVNGPA